MEINKSNTLKYFRIHRFKPEIHYSYFNYCVEYNSRMCTRMMNFLY